MIAALAIASLVVAAADDADVGDDHARQFQVLRTLGDLEGAYAVLMGGMDAIDKIALLVRIEYWIRASLDLETLKARLEEYQAAWMAFTPFETFETGIYQQWPLTEQFRNNLPVHRISGGIPTWIPSIKGFSEHWIPWFQEDDNLSWPSGDYTLFHLPGWPHRLARTDTAHPANDHGSCHVWSADDTRVLVSFATRHGFLFTGTGQNHRARTTHRFEIVSQASIEVLAR